MSIHEETLAVTDLEIDNPVKQDDVIHFDHVSQSALAWADLTDGLRSWPIWLMLSYQDIKLRYRRSILGPFWLTLSMAITIYTMGYIYSHIFHTDMSSYFPYLTGGMLAWTMLSTIVIEFTDGLAASEHLIKQIKLPYTLYIHRIASRNFIIFFHNIVVIIPIMIYYHDTTKISWNMLLLLPDLMIIYVNSISYGLILSMIGARYRDISQIIRSLIQVIFFVTPVMWLPQVLMDKNHWIVDLNPFYSFIELIRAPLLGNCPTLYNYLFILGMTVAGLALSWIMFVKRRARIVYWI
jgi:lipopolysaccharide transport system permease protein